jgi:hypothetical protein
MLKFREYALIVYYVSVLRILIDKYEFGKKPVDYSSGRVGCRPLFLDKK